MNMQEKTTAAAQESAPEIEQQPIWPDYFARLGQPDAANWHYQGYWKDTLTCWRAYYSLMLFHPIVSFLGLRHFCQSLVYRISTEKTGDRLSPVISILTPLLMLLGAPLCNLAVAIAVPVLTGILKIPRPPLFRPFTFIGWANYNIMLATMFTLHGYKQFRLGLEPAQALRHSSKMFWHKLFTEGLPEGQQPTRVFGEMINNQFSGEIPEDNLVIKPTSAGGGQFLRTLRWDEDNGIYHCDDPEKMPEERSTYTPQQLREFIHQRYTNMMVEKFYTVREPLPISSIRILTINISGKSELLSAAFLPAPEGSNSTAYFDLDTHLIDWQNSCIGDPIRPFSEAPYRGIALPEMNDMVNACLAMHDSLPGHVEISWDVILTEEGPVYLEGNVFPPGCDYKLSIFKKYSNFVYLRDRILNEVG